MIFHPEYLTMVHQSKNSTSGLLSTVLPPMGFTGRLDTHFYACSDQEPFDLLMSDISDINKMSSFFSDQALLRR
jgi:hypothetical protein